MFLKRLIVNSLFVFKNILPIVFLSKEKEIANYLVKNAIRIGTAESCTGGLLSSRLTDISGSSAYVFENFVTYANDSKIRLLNVKADTIEKNGVVSSEVALEMAQGLLEKYNCDLAVTTTGIAGPLGATQNLLVLFILVLQTIKYKNLTNLKLILY
jgi:PncC family amidohydrolase